jgi:ATP-dependent Clp protease ATP-binding subunit ClpA
MFERFTQPARECLVSAQRDAEGLGHHYVGTEHLLLGLVEGDTEAARVLASFGVTHDGLLAAVRRVVGEGDLTDADALASIGIDLDEVRRRVEAAFGRGALEQTRAGRRFCADRSFTPRAKKALELAAKKARRLGHDWLGPEHLLLGVLAVDGGLAIQLVEDAGVSVERVRDTIISKLDRAA